MEKEGATFEEVRDLVAGARGKMVYASGDADEGIWSAGQVQGLIHDIPTCAELVSRIMREAEAIIQSRLEGMMSGQPPPSRRIKRLHVTNPTKRNDPMKAYVYGANGAEITDVAKPSPKGTQVLVRVHACGLNRADLGMTKGHAHGSAGGVGTVLGMEWAGEVAELGPDAKGVKVGDKVMGSGGAAFAEYTLADHGRLFRTAMPT